MIALICGAWGITATAAAPKANKQTPNILFFIMDDVGIDQMKTFGYGGATAPRRPTSTRSRMPA